MEFEFQNFPDKTIIRIFRHFSLDEIVNLRLVNKWFNKICSRKLNETFLSIKNELEAEINVIGESNRKEDEVCDVQLKYKILQILRNEITTLYVVCQKYVERNLYTFAGGKILDSFYDIINRSFDLTNTNNPLECHVAMMLFLMCEEFSDHFESVVEPMIIENSFSPWYGSKIMDFLDLFLNSNYHITATYLEDSCQISGRYEILNPECLSELKLNSTDMAGENLRLVARYVRNQMRWHNFFYYVDATHETINLNKKKDRKYSKFCLNSNNTGGKIEFSDGNNKITKTFSRRLGNPCSKENVSFALELQCSKNFMPHRLKACAPTFFIDNNSDTPSEGIGDSQGQNNRILYTEESARIYDFLLTLKFVLPSSEKNCANENCLELYHSLNNCEVTQKSKEIPI